MTTVVVVVVEDDQDIALLLSTLLTRAGFDVVTAHDGSAGLAAIASSSPELVLLDIGLPVIDGWEVLRRIRGGSTVPVMLLTARDEDDAVNRGYAAGADDYLTKPFGNTQLIERVRALLHRDEDASRAPDRATA